MKRLSDIGEDALIKRLVARLEMGREDGRRADRVVVAPGDDCAVVDVGRRGEFQLLKTDALVEGVHYLAETPAVRVGWKAVARVISDFAAMGGWSGQLLVTIAMPADKEVRYVEEIYRGMNQCATAYGAVICGGETSSVPQGSAAVISVAGTGWVKKSQCVRRSGGKVGDRILVTGKLGGSIAGKHLDFLPRMEEARWLVSHFRIHAMMDLSDGLARDLPRLAEASSCGFLIDEKSIPRNSGCDLSHAMGDGEDYELLLTVSKQLVDRLCESWIKKFPQLPLTMVGELTELTDPLSSERLGWEHFTS